MNIEDLNQEKEITINDILKNIISYINSSNEDVIINPSKLKIGADSVFESGYDLSTKLESVGGKYKSTQAGSRIEIYPTRDIAIRIIDDEKNDVFKAYVGGDNIGDVVIGDYDNNQGFKYDKSENKTIYKGNIEASTITGGTIQTATTGKRIKISSSPQNKIEFLNNNDWKGQLEFDGDEVNGYYVALTGPGGTMKIHVAHGAGSDYASFEVPFLSTGGKSSVGWVTFEGPDSAIHAVGLEWTGGGEPKFNFNIGSSLVRIDSHLYPDATNDYWDLGSSSYKWRSLYLSGNIYVDGVVDGVDVSAHAANANAHHAQSHTHASHTGIGPDDHHSSTSNGLNITPATVAATGTGIGTSSALKAPSICTTSGYIYYNGDLVFSMHPDKVRCYKMLGPNSGAYQNLGDSTYYWNEVNYVTLVKRSGFGFLDKGVELQDGRIVSDLEAIVQLAEDKTEKTPYGSTIIDKRTLPKIVYRPATHPETGEILPRDSNGKPYWERINEETNKKERVYAVDGEDVNAMLSIFIGAFKELDKKFKELDKKYEELSKKVNLETKT